MSRQFSRRKFLAGLTTTLTGITGCTEGDGSPTVTEPQTTVTGETVTTVPGTPTDTLTGSPTDTETPTETETPTPTPVPGPEIEEVENSEIEFNWRPSIDQVEEIPEDQKTTIEIDTNSFSTQQLELEIEKDALNSKTVPVENTETTLTTNQLYKGEQELRIRYQSEEGEKTSEPVTVDNDTPDAYRLEIHNPQQENLNDWNTVYTFDDHTFNADDFHEIRQESLEEYAYQQVLDDPYSFGLPENWSEKQVTDAETYRQILREGTNAVKERNEEVNPIGPSSGNTEIASTTKLLYQQERNEDIISGSLTAGGGHGLTIFHDQEHGHGWHMVNTTNSGVAKPTSGQNVTDLWIPWSDYGADVDKDVDLTYGTEKLLARQGLTSIATNYGTNWDPNKFFINDEWLESAYRSIRRDDDPEPILEPLKHAIDRQRKEGGYAGVYGNNLEDTRTAYGEDLSGLRETVMEETESVTPEEIESHLENAS